MTQDALAQAIAAKIEARSLLTHRFYQAWNAGTLPIESLRQYAAQYYHFETAFPTFLSAVHSRTTDQRARQQILANLWDEEHGDSNHTALWLRFCQALGLDPAAVPATPVQESTRRLIDTYRELCGDGPMEQGMAALLAYEAQVPAVAAKKIEGLKAFYGMDDPRSIAFFTVHAEQDTTHAAAERSLVLAASSDDHAAVLAAVDRSLDALWGFLDGVYAEECVAA